MADYKRLASVSQSTEVIRTSNHVYYNVTVFNNSNDTIPATFSETRNEYILEKPSDYYLSVIRAAIPTSEIPIFIFPGLWDTIGGLKIPTNSATEAKDPPPGVLPISVTLSYNGTDSKQNIEYIPSIVDYKATASEDERYYFVYAYQDFLRMINRAILKAYNGLYAALPVAGTVYAYKIVTGGTGYTGATTITISAPAAGVTALATPIITGGVITGVTITNAGSGYTDAKAPFATIVDGGGGAGADIRFYAAPNWVPPYADYEKDTGSLSITAQVGYDSDISNPIQLFFSTQLYTYFGVAQITNFYDYPTAVGKDYQIAFRNLYNNAFDLTTFLDLAYIPDGWAPGFATATPAVYSTKAYRMEQEFASLATWTDFSTLLLQTGSVPIRNEFAPALNPNQNEGKQTGGGFIPIMTDFTVPNQTGIDVRNQIVYTPQSEYRLIDMMSDSPMKTFDVGVFWTEVNGTIHRLSIPPRSNVSFKFMFRRKDFNNTENTNVSKGLLAVEQLKLFK